MGLDSMSNEQLSKLATQLNDAKALRAQDEALTQKTLANEQKIIKQRNEGIKEYSDTVNSLLDAIDVKQDQLSTSFTIITEEGKKAVENIKKAVKTAKEFVNTTKSAASNKEPSYAATLNKATSKNVTDTYSDSGSSFGGGGGGSAGGSIYGGGNGGSFGGGFGGGGDRNNFLGDLSGNFDDGDGIVPDHAAIGDFKTSLTSAFYEAFAAKGEAMMDAAAEEAALEEARAKSAQETAKKLADLETSAHDNLIKLMLAREQLEESTAAGKIARAQAVKEQELKTITDVFAKETEAITKKNQLQAELDYLAGGGVTEASYQLRQQQAVEEEAFLDDLKTQMALRREELIFQAKIENNGILDAEALAQVNKRLAAEFSGEENRQKLKEQFQVKQFNAEIRKRKEKEKAEKTEAEAKEKQLKEAAKGILTGGKDRKEKYNEAKDAIALEKAESLRALRDADGKQLYSEEEIAETANKQAEEELNAEILKQGMQDMTNRLTKALSNLLQQVGDKAEKIAENKGKIDTRLHGSNKILDVTGYWENILKKITAVGAVNPFFKQEDFANKIKELVDAGIAFDLEQRAFMATIKDKIATTFDATNGTLLRLIRIQQEDSTAGRLGMEVALNAFLNEMYKNTEYLQTVATSVKTSLEEMQSLMSGATATEVEYQIQKWLGSLYSVGMSQDAVGAISGALGQIAAGQIEGLTGNGAGNLLIMAANEAGIPITDILSKGMDADETNDLLQAAVNYLAKLAESSEDNQVVQQQLATVFGVKASDLRAATNLASKGSVGVIHDETATYSNMLNKLYGMASTMGMRTSISEKLSNVWDNTIYSLASVMSDNVASYAIMKAASLLQDMTGDGIALPFVNVMGFGVDLNTSVADLMRVAAIAGPALGSMGQLIAGLASSTNGAAMLASMGVGFGSGLKVTPRGGGGGDSGVGGGGGAGGADLSESGYAGNSSGNDIKDSTMQESEDSKEQLMVEAKEEAEETQVDVLNTLVLKIYELLDDIANGESSFKVKVDGYGLTKAGGKGVLGGVSALDSVANAGGAGGGAGSGGLGAGGVNAGGGGSYNLGGWTTTI